MTRRKQEEKKKEMIFNVGAKVLAAMLSYDPTMSVPQVVSLSLDAAKRYVAEFKYQEEAEDLFIIR